MKTLWYCFLIEEPKEAHHKSSENKKVLFQAWNQKKIQCSYCRKSGHIKRFCFIKLKDEEAKKTKAYVTMEDKEVVEDDSCLSGDP